MKIEALAAHRFADLMPDCEVHPDVFAGYEYPWNIAARIVERELRGALGDALNDGEEWALELLIDSRLMARDYALEDGITDSETIGQWTMDMMKEKLSSIVQGLKNQRHENWFNRIAVAS